MSKSTPSALFFILLAMVPGWYGLKYYSETQSYLSRSIETTGTISRYQWSQAHAGSDSDKSFNPMISFHTRNGSLTEVKANIVTENDVHNIGEEVTVFYDPNNFNQVRLDTYESLYA